MVAMLTARARVPATCMACVGGPAVGRGARRRRDLLRRSATSAPTRLLPRLLPRLDRLRALGGTKARTETRRTPTMRQKSSVLTTSHHRRAIRPRHLPKLPTLPQSGTRLKLPSAAGWSGRQLVRRTEEGSRRLGNRNGSGGSTSRGEMACRRRGACCCSARAANGAAC